MEVILASPRGFCAGVERAISIVERALEQLGAPIYVRHEVVHNRYVVDNLREKGVIFVESLIDVPDGCTVIFSAHGVSQSVRDEATRRQLHVFDATCPLVTKVHAEVRRLRAQDYDVIMIGHAGHPEVDGTMGQVSAGMYLVETVADVVTIDVKNTAKLAYVTQTTLSVDDAAVIVDALKARFVNIVGPKRDDICYATQNRQDAVKLLAQEVDLVIVIGSENSSNTNRLREVVEKGGLPGYRIDDVSQLRPEWFEGALRVGITAGASAPEILVQRVVTKLRELGAVSIRTLSGIEENVSFPLPKALSRSAH